MCAYLCSRFDRDSASFSDHVGLSVWNRKLLQRRGRDSVYLSQPNAEPCTGSTQSRVICVYPALTYSLSNDDIVYPVEEEDSLLTPQEKALKWMIENDPKQEVLKTGSIGIGETDVDRILQRFALATLYFTTEGPLWDYSNHWLSEANHCDWEGVSCDGQRNNDVTALDLEKYNLWGSVPSDIRLLTEMIDLWLDSNSLNGTFPLELLADRWPLLEFLPVGVNQLTGLPDNVGKWTSPEEIFVDRNSLNGTLPVTIGSWQILKEFVVWGSDVSGSLSSAIGNLEPATFRGWGNSFTGSIPDSFGAWTDMIEFSVFVTSLQAVSRHRLELGQK